jgi:predicted RNA binding protein YcfA (HicA-like mRNA interferase family)
MPKKVRELKQYLSKAGFVLQKGRGKGSHTYWIHPDLESPLIMPGKDGDDAPIYLERQVNKALQLLAILEEEKENDSSNDDSNDES